MRKSCHQYRVLQVQDYVNDKLNFIGPVRARTGNEILKGFRSLEHRQAQLHLPILAVHGTSDRCTSLPVQPLSITLHQFVAQDTTGLLRLDFWYLLTTFALLLIFPILTGQTTWSLCQCYKCQQSTVHAT